MSTTNVIAIVTTYDRHGEVETLEHIHHFGVDTMQALELVTLGEQWANPWRSVRYECYVDGPEDVRVTRVVVMKPRQALQRGDMTGTDILRMAQAVRDEINAGRRMAQSYKARLANLVTRFPRNVVYFGDWHK